MEKRLYRSRSDRVISGVCGGLAEYFEIDPTLVRVAVVVLGLLTQGGILIAYLIMAVVVPEEPVSDSTASPAAAYAASASTPEEGFAVTESETRTAPPTPETPPPVLPAPVAPSVPPYAPATAPRAHSARGLWWGLALIVVGMILLADQLLPGVSLWQYWPVIIVVIGLATVIRAVRRS